MGISYHKCAYCKWCNSESAFNYNIDLPDAYKEDYDVCDDCVEELFELEIPVALGPDYDEAQIYYVKNISDNSIKQFTEFNDFMRHIDQEQEKGNELAFDIVGSYSQRVKGKSYDKGVGKSDGGSDGGNDGGNDGCNDGGGDWQSDGSKQDIDDLTFETLDYFHRWCPKKGDWKKRERERIDCEINILEKKRKMLDTFLFI